MSVRAGLPDLEHWKAQVKCQAGCPVSTDAGRYVQLIAAGRDEEAYLVARAPNPFASVCGRVCAAPCEDACRRSAIDAPIAIRALKRFVTEKCGPESIRPDTQDRLREALVSEGNRYAGHLPVQPVGFRPARPSGPAERAGRPGIEGERSGQPGAARGRARRKVAVIGAGPAGLSAAHDLPLLGYHVTVFEASEEPGGMMRFGIPECRLPRTLIRAEIDKILELGVTLRPGTPLTAAYGLAELKRDGFEAVFLSVDSFVGNLTPLTLVGRRTDTVFEGSYWSDNDEPDLDGDGRSDRPYRLSNVFDHFRGNLTAADLFARGPAAAAIAAAERALPVLHAVAVVDRSPLARPPSLPDVPAPRLARPIADPAGILASLAVLVAGAAALAAGRRAPRPS